MPADQRQSELHCLRVFVQKTKAECTANNAPYHCLSSQVHVCGCSIAHVILLGWLSECSTLAEVHTLMHRLVTCRNQVTMDPTVKMARTGIPMAVGAETATPAASGKDRSWMYTW